MRAPADPLRIALVGQGEGDVAGEVRDGLLASGHHVVMLGEYVGLGTALEEVLRRRGFTSGTTAIPWMLRRLHGGGFDLAHALSAPAAHAARLWGRRTRRPVVYTCSEVLDRGTVADRRLRLTLLAGAVEGSDAVTATSEEARAALRRWMAVDARVMAPGDGSGYDELYRELLVRAGVRG